MAKKSYYNDVNKGKLFIDLFLNFQSTALAMTGSLNLPNQLFNLFFNSSGFNFQSVNSVVLPSHTT
jgi:hypothetical protein